MQKKLLAFFLLFLFLFNTMGYFFIFEVSKIMVKREMRIAIQQRPREFTRLEVTKAAQNRDLERIEKREIRYQGNMYDIIWEETQGDVTIFYCLRDHKEEMLVAGLKNVHHTRYSLKLQEHLIKIALPPVFSAHLQPPANIFDFPVYHIEYCSWILNTWSPPPEVA